MREKTDVVVLGGGPSGCAAALGLARRGLRVVVIEASSYGAGRVGESVPPNVRVLLGRMGLLSDFLAEGHEPCGGSASSWGSHDVGHNDFLWNPYGHGFHLDRRRFDAFLAERARGSGVAVRTGVRFGGHARRTVEGICVSLAHGEGGQSEIEARFAVDATGPAAHLARRMGARRIEIDRVVFVTATLGLPSASRLSCFTLLEAVEYGWWYAARLPRNRAVVALATSPSHVKEGSLMDAPEILARAGATKHVGPALAGCAVEPDGVTVRAVRSGILDEVAGDRWLAVGDAASTYDPLTSQGIYKALESGERAAVAIASALESDLSGLTAYREHVRSRFEGYARLRSHLYEQERRWSEAPFWAERRSRVWPAAAAQPWLASSPVPGELRGVSV